MAARVYPAFLAPDLEWQLLRDVEFLRYRSLSADPYDPMRRDRFVWEFRGGELPSEPGVYAFLAGEAYPCPRGKSRVLRIGQTDDSLRTRVRKHYEPSSTESRPCKF